MPAILVSPAEPGAIKALGTVSSFPESKGADIIVPGHGFLIGVQRKQFPGDFLSSLSDGRFNTLVMKLCQVDMPILLIEGKQNWTFSGQLLGHDHGQGRRFSRVQLRGLEWSLFREFGITTMYTDDINDTTESIRELSRWARKPHHDSLLQRPGPDLKGAKRLSSRDWGVHVLQGFESIGPELAGRIYDHFGRVPLSWDVDESELLEVEGIGPKRVERMGL